MSAYKYIVTIHRRFPLNVTIFNILILLVKLIGYPNIGRY